MMWFSALSDPWSICFPAEEARLIDVSRILKSRQVFNSLAVCSEFRYEGLKIIWRGRKILMDLQGSDWQAFNQSEWKQVETDSRLTRSELLYQGKLWGFKKPTHSKHKVDKAIPRSLAKPELVHDIAITVFDSYRKYDEPNSCMRDIFRTLSLLTKNDFINLDTIVLDLSNLQFVGPALARDLKFFNRIRIYYHNVDLPHRQEHKERCHWWWGGCWHFQFEQSLADQVRNYHIRARDLQMENVHDDIFAVLESPANLDPRASTLPLKPVWFIGPDRCKRRKEAAYAYCRQEGIKRKLANRLGSAER